MECLVTRLKGVVSNENLERFDLITTGLPVTEFIRKIAERFHFWPKLYLKCLNGTVITNYNGTETFTELKGENLPNPQVVLHDSVPGSVDWNFLKSEMIAGAFDISDIYSESIIGIHLIRDTTAGDVEGVNTAYGTTKNIGTRFPNLQVFMCLWVSPDHLYGNLNDFANATSLFEIHIVGSQGIVGDLKELAEGQIAAGRTSGNIKVLCNAKITNNGAPVAENTWMKITFNDNSYTITQGE